MLLSLLGTTGGPRIYAVVYPSSLSAPSVAQIKLGQNVNGNPATWASSVSAPSATTTYDWPSLATGLTAGTSYKVSFVWSDGTADSAPETSSAFTTTGGGAFELDASAGAYAAVGAAADVAAERSVEATAGSYAVTGSASDVVAERSVEAQSGGYSLTGASAELVGPAAGFELEALAGAYSATGAIADVAAQREIEASPGAYALAGANADVSAGREVDAVSGVYVATGAGANVDAQREIEASPGTYSLAGASAELIGPAPAFELEALAGSYAATGAAAEAVADRFLDAQPGNYVLSGTAADLQASRALEAQPGAYNLSGADADLNIAGLFALNAEPGAYLSSGADAGLEAPRREAENFGGGHPRRHRGKSWKDDDERRKFWELLEDEFKAIISPPAETARTGPERTEEEVERLFSAFSRSEPARTVGPFPALALGRSEDDEVFETLQALVAEL